MHKNLCLTVKIPSGSLPSMDMRKWIQVTTPDERRDVAEAAGTTVGYLYNIAGRSRRPSSDLAMRLEKATEHMRGRRLKKESLLWPE